MKFNPFNIVPAGIELLTVMGTEEGFDGGSGRSCDFGEGVRGVLKG